MTIATATVEPGIVTVTVDFPGQRAAVGELCSELGDAITAAGRDMKTSVVILRLRPRSNVGVDIKEDAGHRGLRSPSSAPIGAAPTRSPPSTTARVLGDRGGQRLRVGGGIAWSGCNADCIVASDDAIFGLGSRSSVRTGAATHLARLVPQHMMRTLYYTAQNATAQQLHQFGSVYNVVLRAELDEAALEVARKIAAKDTRVIRAAKEAINGIDPVDVKTSYRLELGYT